jgi:hypothetical protein
MDATSKQIHASHTATPQLNAMIHGEIHDRGPGEYSIDRLNTWPWWVWPGVGLRFGGR